MIELLVGPLIGERTSPEAGKLDEKDGGPPRGGELILAIDPAKFGNAEGWEPRACSPRCSNKRAPAYRPTAAIRIAKPPLLRVLK